MEPGDNQLHRTFLRKWLDRVENEELSTEESRRLTEFMMREMMLGDIQKQGEDISYAMNDESNDKKWLKYFTLGWFVYEHLGVEGH
jgi:hypothetical protein